jgi:hypothetical protein
MATFPGYFDTKYQEWIEKFTNPIIECTSIVWGIFNTVSTVLAIVGI